MECQPSDSKKLFNVFDASKRKRTKKKCDGFDDSNSAGTEDSISVSIHTVYYQKHKRSVSVYENKLYASS